MKRYAWISWCSAATLLLALTADSHPEVFVGQARASTPEPCVIHLSSLNYPLLARQSRIQGKVTASVLVYRDGTASVAKEGTGQPLLLEAAQENLKTWRFRPNDATVPIQLEVEYVFVLDPQNPMDDFNVASTMTLDLPRRVRVSAPVLKANIDSWPVKNKN